MLARANEHSEGNSLIHTMKSSAATVLAFVNPPFEHMCDVRESCSVSLSTPA